MEYKIGERVKIVKTYHPDGHYRYGNDSKALKLGSTGIIYEVSKDYYRLSIDDSPLYWNVDESEIEKICKFQVGPGVRLVKIIIGKAEFIKIGHEGVIDDITYHPIMTVNFIGNSITFSNNYDTMWVNTYTDKNKFKKEPTMAESEKSPEQTILPPPETELEKTACEKAKQASIQYVIANKQYLYQKQMDNYLSLVNRRKQYQTTVDDLTKDITLLETNLNITEEQKKQLF
jgi:hypothetical protein